MLQVTVSQKGQFLFEKNQQEIKQEKSHVTPRNIPVLPIFTLDASGKDNIITQLIEMVMWS